MVLAGSKLEKKYLTHWQMQPSTIFLENATDKLRFLAIFILFFVI